MFLSAAFAATAAQIYLNLPEKEGYLK